MVESEAALVESLVGHTIIKATWVDQAPNDDWTGHEVATLWLDDGRVIEFGGWGHDAWGATATDVTPPTELIHV